MRHLTRLIMAAVMAVFFVPAVEAQLTGSTPADTYKDLLHMSNSNTGADATLRAVNDGAGNALPLWLSTNMVMVQRDSATASEVARLYNGDDTATGETTQTAQLSFYLDGSTDSGSTRVAHEAARIDAF